MVKGAANRFADKVSAVLVQAGWTPGQTNELELRRWSRELEPVFSLFPAATSALERFGGLRIEQDGSGETHIRETFELLPTLALGMEDVFREYEHRLGTKLYPLGEAGNGRVLLAIATDGRVYAFMDELWLVADNIEEAIESLVCGRPIQRIDA